MRSVGHDPAAIQKRAARLTAQKQAAWEAAEARDATQQGQEGDVDMEQGEGEGKLRQVRGKAIDRAPGRNRQFAGMATGRQSEKAKELRMFAQREPARLAKASESDRHIPITRPKWMLAGKRKGGKTDRR